MYSYNKQNRKTNTGLNSSLNILLLILRLIFGCVFVFSGFVKAIDPLGSTYKIQDYLIAFGGFFEYFLPLALPAAILLSTLELVTGLNMLFNIRFKLTTWLGLLFMLVMTPLTLYIAVKNPVSDCGCFGDALVISNNATFIKNLFLLAIIIVLFVMRNRVKPVFMPKLEWLIVLLFFVAGILISVYNYRHLPMIDFRPYKVGVNLPEAMSVPEGYPQDKYEITFIYEKEGEQKEFTLDNYPKNDSTWTFVDQKSVLISKGYEPPVHDFSIEDENLDDITEEVLEYEGYTYLVIIYDINAANKKALLNVQKLYERTLLSGDTKFYALTASSDKDIEALRQRTGITYPFYTSDPTTLKTIIRSNPGIVLIKNGTIEAKWHWRDFEW